MAGGRELALGHPHLVGDVLVEEALVPVLLLRPLAHLGVDQGYEVSLVPLLPLGDAGHPLHCKCYNPLSVFVCYLFSVVIRILKSLSSGLRDVRLVYTSEDREGGL